MLSFDHTKLDLERWFGMSYDSTPFDPHLRRSSRGGKSGSDGSWTKGGGSVVFFRDARHRKVGAMGEKRSPSLLPSQ